MTAKVWRLSGVSGEWLAISARTAIAGVVSLLVARALKLPEAFWAPITAMVVMQSTLGAAEKVSAQRLGGTALGAVLGVILRKYFDSSVVAFALGVFVLGMLSAVFHINRAAYRFSGMTLAIVMLIQHAGSPWVIGFDRFLEVAIGIAASLLTTAAWPGPPAPRNKGASA
jgi:uncharacterized membrane protein YccC